MKTTTCISSAAVGVGLTLSLCTNAPVASARWNVHDEGFATQFLATPGGTEDETCSSRLRGQSGWLAVEDPDTYVPDPATTGAYGALRYQAWKAPQGFSSFQDAQEEFDASGNFTGYVFDDHGTELRATLVGDVVTPNRHLLDDPLPTASNDFVFTLADFTIDLDATVHPGDVIRVRAPALDNPASLTDQTVVDCSFAVQGREFRAKAKRSFSRIVATFSGPGAAADYAASIKWLDGTSSTGQIRQVGDHFTVVGVHRYAHQGHYPIRVSVSQTYTRTSHRSVTHATIR